MRAVVVSEYRKLMTTNLWWILGLLMIGYMAFLGAALAFGTTVEAPEGTGGTGGMGGDGELTDLDIAQSVYTVSASLGYVFPLVVGALMMTGEFRHQTITPTLLAEPRRGRILIAKLIVAAAVGAAYGVAGTLGGVLGAVPVLALQDVPLQLGEAEVLGNLAMSVLALAIWAVLGVGVGTVLSNQVAAVVAILAFTQFVEPILRFGLGAVDALSGAGRLLPGAAAEAIVGASFYSASGLVDLLSRPAGAAVLLTYALVLAAIGRWTTLRRDIT